MNTDKNNADLQAARSNKADEFYTQYEDIEAEMKLYGSAFRGKIVYCPCDDYRVSNFYKYFKDNFHKLGLKKLIATSYDVNGVGNYISKDKDSEQYKVLVGNGSFDSMECQSLMSCSDIIVTNPPFSLFRKFITQIFKYNKQMIILGNVNAITYKEVFHHIIKKELYLGGSIHSGDRAFRVPDNYPLDGVACFSDGSANYIRVKGVRWFTNIPYEQPQIKHTVLTCRYNSGNYQKYDTYNAINVNSMKEIPFDYFREIGAPITVLDKMNSHTGLCEFVDDDGDLITFEVIGQLNAGNNTANFDFAKPIIDGKCKFKRLIIKRKD